MRKDEVLAGLNKGTYSLAEVKNIVQQVSTKVIPEVFKKGDVFLAAAGDKMRPCVAAKVSSELIYAIPLTHENGAFNSVPYKSRMWGDGYLSKALVTIGPDRAKDSFQGIFDHPRALNEAIKLLKQEVNKI